MAKSVAMRTQRKRTTSETRKIPELNIEAIRWLDAWAKKPPSHDVAFWDDFERELKQNRFNLRRPK